MVTGMEDLLPVDGEVVDEDCMSICFALYRLICNDIDF